MTRSGMVRGVFCFVLAWIAVAAPATSEARSSSTSLRTVEGEVQAIARAAGEGGLELVQVRLSLEKGKGSGTALAILLAPSEVMNAIGLEVTVGDRLRVKYYADDAGRAMAHKVLNQSRGTMVRLRTIRQLPLWDSRGVWHGGPCRTRSGGGGGPGGAGGSGGGGPGGRN